MTKNRPIQIMIALGVISIIGIIAVQVFWVSLSVTAEEETFDHNVRMSLRAVADNMCQIDGNELISNKPIDRISRNYFVARLRYNIDISVLDSLIKYQFDMRDINQDYEYGVYNCESDQMVFGNQVLYKSESQSSRISLPKLAADEYYFGVFFPNKTGGLLASMNLWKYMTGAMLLMLAFFGYGLVIVLKQRRLSEIQKDFIDNVTHELKTPLATLRLSADAIHKSNDREKTQKYAEIIDQETRRLEQHVNQILSSSGIEESNTHSKRVVDMDQYLAELLEQFKLEYPSVHWELIIDTLGQLNVNLKSFETILRNLVDNAVRYGNGKVKIVACQKPKNLEIIVEDNGNGIPVKYHKKIYDKFFRIPTENIHDVKGYGLGMYLVKENCKKIKARIELKSSETGTSFKVYVPI